MQGAIIPPYAVSFDRSPLELSSGIHYSRPSSLKSNVNIDTQFIASLRTFPKRDEQSFKTEKNSESNEKESKKGPRVKSRRLISAGHYNTFLSAERFEQSSNELRKKLSKKYAHIKSKVDTNFDQDKKQDDQNTNETKARRIHSAVVWRSDTSRPNNGSNFDSTDYSANTQNRAKSASVFLQSDISDETFTAVQPQVSLFSPRSSTSQFTNSNGYSNLKDVASNSSSSQNSNDTKNILPTSSHLASQQRLLASESIIETKNQSILQNVQSQVRVDSSSRTKPSSAAYQLSLNSDKSHGSLLPSRLAAYNSLSNSKEYQRSTDESEALYSSPRYYNPRDSLTLNTYKRLKEHNSSFLSKPTVDANVQAIPDDLLRKKSSLNDIQNLSRDKSVILNGKPPLPNRQKILSSTRTEDSTDAHVEPHQKESSGFSKENNSWRSSYDYIYGNRNQNNFEQNPHGFNSSVSVVPTKLNSTWNEKTGNLELDLFLKEEKENIRKSANDIIDNYLQHSTTSQPSTSSEITLTTNSLKSAEKRSGNYGNEPSLLEHQDSSERMLTKYLNSPSINYVHSAVVNDNAKRPSYFTSTGMPVSSHLPSVSISEAANNITSWIDNMTLDNLKNQSSNSSYSKQTSNNRHNVRSLISDNMYSSNEIVKLPSFSNTSYATTQKSKTDDPALNWVMHSLSDSLIVEKGKRKKIEDYSGSFSENEQPLSSIEFLPPLRKTNYLSMSVPAGLNRITSARSILKKEKRVRIAVENNRYHCYTPEYEKPLRKLSDIY